MLTNQDRNLILEITKAQMGQDTTDLKFDKDLGWTIDESLINERDKLLEEDKRLSDIQSFLEEEKIGKEYLETETNSKRNSLNAVLGVKQLLEQQLSRIAQWDVGFDPTLNSIKDTTYRKLIGDVENCLNQANIFTIEIANLFEATPSSGFAKKQSDIQDKIHSISHQIEYAKRLADKLNFVENALNNT